MQKIFNYILKGQGLGIKFLLLLSLIISLSLAILLKIEGTPLIPYAQNIADQMLSIKIENGVVTQPQDILRTAKIQLDDSQEINFPLVLDTRIDTFDSSELNQLQDGIYMTRTAIYSINKGQTKIQALSGSFDFEKKDYTNIFKRMLTYASIFLGISGIFFMFIYYFIASIFYAFCAQLISIIFKKRYTFEQRMRLAVLSFIGCYIAVYLIEFLIGSIGTLTFFIIVIALEILIISKLPKPESSTETTLDMQTKEEKGEDK